MHSQVLLSTIHVQMCTLDRCCEHQRTHLLNARYRLCICNRYREIYIYMYIFIYMYVYFIFIAFITGNSSLEPLIEGLCAQIHVNLR